MSKIKRQNLRQLLCAGLMVENSEADAILVTKNAKGRGLFVRAIDFKDFNWALIDEAIETKKDAP